MYSASVTCQLPAIGRAMDVDSGLKSRLLYATCAVMVSATEGPPLAFVVPVPTPQPLKASVPANTAAAVLAIRVFHEYIGFSSSLSDN